jgi:hypothetical protein
LVTFLADTGSGQTTAPPNLAGHAGGPLALQQWCKLQLSFPTRRTFLAQADFPDLTKLGVDEPPPSHPLPRRQCSSPLALFLSQARGTTHLLSATLSMAEFINDDEKRRRMTCGSHVSMTARMSLRAMV